MRTLARQAAYLAVAGILLSPPACKRDAGDGLLALRISADAANPPAVAGSLVLSGTPGGIVRTYPGEVRIQVGTATEFQFPGLPAGGGLVTFTVRTYSESGCLVGQNANTIATAIEAGAKAGPIDVTLVSVAGCTDAAVSDAATPSADAAGNEGSVGASMDSGSEGAGAGGQTNSRDGAGGEGGQSDASIGSSSTGGRPGDGGAELDGLAGTGGLDGGGTTGGTGGVLPPPSGGGGGGMAGLGGTAGLGTGGTTAGTGGVLPPPSGGSGSGGHPGTGGIVATGGTTSSPGTGGTGTGGTTQGTGGIISGTGGSTAGPGSPGCGKTPTLQNSPSTEAKQNGIGDRQFLVRWPSSYDSSHPYRLVLSFHGYGGDDTKIGPSYFGLFDLAGDSTIFVAPSASGGSWNATADVTFVDQVLAAVEADLCIDTSRIMLEGFSQGAAMVAVLACSRPGVFRAAVGHSRGGLTPPTACQPIPYLGSAGLTDMAGSSQATHTDAFAGWNGCTIEPLQTAPAGGHICTNYNGCPAADPVVWCSFDGSHTPSPTDSGQTTSWMPQTVWTFLSQF